MYGSLCLHIWEIFIQRIHTLFPIHEFAARMQISEQEFGVSRKCAMRNSKNLGRSALPGPRPAERQQEAWSKVVVQPPPPPRNLQIMAYAPKSVSFGINAFKAFWGILKNRTLTIWDPSEYEALGQSAPIVAPLSVVLPGPRIFSIPSKTWERRCPNWDVLLKSINNEICSVVTKKLFPYCRLLH